MRARGTDFALDARVTDRRSVRAAGARIAAELGVTRVAAAVTSAARPLLLAGWTPRDVVTALTHRPDGSRWRAESAIRAPYRWSRWRLTHWAGMEPPSVTRQVTRAREQAHAAALSAQFEAARQAAVPVPSWFAAVRRSAGLR